jgi:hypothetical protein
LIQRTEDDWVQQSLTQSRDRQMITDELDIYPRTVWPQERRSYACAFRLNELTKG